MLAQILQELVSQPKNASDSMQQRLMDQMDDFLNKDKKNEEEIQRKISQLDVIKNVLVFENTVYQLQNLTTIQLADLTEEKTTYSEKRAAQPKFPIYGWFLLILGILTLAAGIGFLILLYVGWMFWTSRGATETVSKTEIQEKYGLKISMNSGEQMIFVSRSKDFVLNVIQQLLIVITSDEPKALTINFDNLQVEDRSINIGESHGSLLVSGSIAGDLVSNV
jgi:hypothetical protein